MNSPVPSWKPDPPSTSRRRAVSLFACVLLALAGLLASSGCSRSDSPGSTGPANPAFVHINSPTTLPDWLAACSQLLLSGDASISNEWWSCCTGTTPDLTGVLVTWQNTTTGQSGTASQYVHICSFFSTSWPCQPHTWAANVPLAVGVNAIVITATHKEGWQATATINVTLPAATHTVTGRVLNQDSTPMRGILLTLDAGLGNTDTAYSSSDGSYSLACVAPGNYTLTPSTTLAYPYLPANRTVTVLDSDIPAQDFITQAWALAGTVNGSGGPVSAAHIMVSGTGGNGYTYTDANGRYRLLVPNGNWTLTAEACYITTCHTITPDSIAATVAFSDITGLDFTVWP